MMRAGTARRAAAARRRAVWRRAGAWAAAAAGLLLAVALPAAPASAHDYPVSWSPAPGSTVTTPPGTVSITFDDIVLDLDHDSRTSLLTVTGPGAAGRHFETGCATTLGRRISAPVALGTAGTYTISYQIVSADGHPVSGSQTFTYRPPAGASPAAGTAASACHHASSTKTAAGQAEPAARAAASPVPGLLIGIVGGVIGLAVLATVIVLVVPALRRR